MLGTIPAVDPAAVRTRMGTHARAMSANYVDRPVSEPNSADHKVRKRPSHETVRLRSRPHRTPTLAFRPRLFPSGTVPGKIEIEMSSCYSLVLRGPCGFAIFRKLFGDGIGYESPEKTPDHQVQRPPSRQGPLRRRLQDGRRVRPLLRRQRTLPARRSARGAPRPANCRAIARPIPRAAPATSTAAPLKSMSRLSPSRGPSPPRRVLIPRPLASSTQFLPGRSVAASGPARP